MHISIAKTNHLKKDVIRVVIDEPRLYVEESLGSVMVRGEVIVNFSKDTHIQGPIELLFEGIQRFEKWPGKIYQYSFRLKANSDINRNHDGQRIKFTN